MNEVLTLDLKKTYEKIAGILPWEIRSVLLENRDAAEEVRSFKWKEEHFDYCYDLGLVDCYGNLTRLGLKITNECTC